MSRNTWFGIACVSLLASCVTPPDDQSAGPAVEVDAAEVSSEVEGLVRALYVGISDQDLEAMRAALTSDFQLTEPQRALRWGVDEFVQAVGGFATNGVVEYQLDQFFTEHHEGEIAYSGYRNRLTFRPTEGDAVTDETIEFAVFIRTAEGWKIDRIHGFVVPFQDD